MHVAETVEFEGPIATHTQSEVAQRIFTLPILTPNKRSFHNTGFLPSMSNDPERETALSGSTIVVAIVVPSVFAIVFLTFIAA